MVPTEKMNNSEGTSRGPASRQAIVIIILFEETRADSAVESGSFGYSPETNIRWAVQFCTGFEVRACTK